MPQLFDIKLVGEAGIEVQFRKMPPWFEEYRGGADGIELILLEGFDLWSCCAPEVSRSTLYFPGSHKSEDTELMVYEMGSPEARDEWIAKATAAEEAWLRSIGKWEIERCSKCGHAPHGQGVCFNMASDNDCDCKGDDLLARDIYIEVMPQVFQGEKFGGDPEYIKRLEDAVLPTYFSNEHAGYSQETTLYKRSCKHCGMMWSYPLEEPRHEPTCIVAEIERRSGK